MAGEPIGKPFHDRSFEILNIIYKDRSAEIATSCLLVHGFAAYKTYPFLGIALMAGADKLVGHEVRPTGGAYLVLVLYRGPAYLTFAGSSSITGFQVEGAS